MQVEYGGILAWSLVKLCAKVVDSDCANAEVSPLRSLLPLFLCSVMIQLPSEQEVLWIGWYILGGKCQKVLSILL